MSFWQAKTKIRPADKLFSEYIRKRDKDCRYRVKCFGHQDFKELHCSHYHGRRKESVRFDPENCDAACRACHAYVHEHPDWLDEWKLNQLGEQRFNALTLRANMPGKKDDQMTIIALKQLLKTL